MKKVLAFCVLSLCALGAFAEDGVMSRLAIPTTRAAGMGGPHVAFTDNVFSLLVNPAAMMRTEQRSFFALNPAIMNPQTISNIVTTVNDMLSASDSDGMLSSLGNAADFLSKTNGKISLGLDLREFPLSIAYVADGFGFGLWDRIYVNPNIIGTHIELNVLADVILPFGFAFKILDTDAHSVDMGLVVKPFFRTKVSEKISIIDLAGGDDALTDITKNFTIPAIVGAGLDLGIMYRWDMGLQAGLTFDDIITRGSVVSDFADLINDEPGTKKYDAYYVPFSMNLGVAYDLKIGKFWAAAPSFLAETGITFAFDWHDVTNAFQQTDYTKRNAALDLGMGLEVKMLKMINLRLGMNEMLPAWGLGFDLGPVEINFAYYGKELGLEPGQLPVAMVDLTIAIRPEAKKRNWIWTRGSVVGLISGAVSE